jgi:predicted lipid-binding transport protein (Tim44 family)
MQHIILGLLVFVVVKSLPEADPDVQQSQAAAKTAEEAAGDEGAKVGKHEQQRVVSPFRRPGQDDKQYSSDGTDQDKQKDGNTVQPELKSSVFLAEGKRRIEDRGVSSGSLPWAGRGRIGSPVFAGIGLGH